MATIYFDLDGTLYDLYNQPSWLARITTNKDASVYNADAAIYDREDLHHVLNLLKARGYRLGVVSWCAKGSTPEFDKETRRAKRAWINDNLPQMDEVRIIRYGTPKHAIVNDKNSILVDDNAEVRAAWTRGATIDASKNILGDLLLLAR